LQRATAICFTAESTFGKYTNASSHMLQQMGDAIILRCFGARATADPYAERGALHPVNPICRDGKAIVQARDVYGHEMRFRNLRTWFWMTDRVFGNVA